MNDSKLTALTDAGLTDREAEVYLALLQSGETPVSEIIAKTNLHPQIVYRNLESLADRGLVTTATRRHRKYVRAEDPKGLVQDLNHRLAQMQAALPDLQALQSLPQEAVVRVAKGNEAIRDLRTRGIDELSAGETYYIIGASGDRFYQIMGKRYDEIERQRVRKGINRRLIAFTSQRLQIEEQEPTDQLVAYRYLPASYPALSSTNIFKDTVAILVWSADPIVITIESADIAESYRQYFNELWRLGEK